VQNIEALTARHGGVVSTTTEIWMAAFLVERGADPNRAGAAWSTPLAWARKKGHVGVADDLMAAGAEAD
jgi:hypothetical protein